MIVDPEKNLVSEKCSINMKACGRFPVLKIADIRNESLSVGSLWENFKIDQINRELLDKIKSQDSDGKDFEELSNSEDNEDVIKKNYFEWNFGYLQNKNGIEPRRILLTIQNVGGTDLDWTFRFPNDNQINAEPWADPGEQSEKEAYEKVILEKNIFEVRPKSGNLKPNMKQNIMLIYSPSLDEEMYDKKGNKEPTQDHMLRAMLQIQNGKVLKLFFRGRTIAHLQGQMQFRRNNYTLPSLPIGMMLPVIFPIQMENVGTSKIQYVISSEQINENNLRNGAARVFEIENRDDHLVPNEKRPLFILFKPTEIKEYNFTLNVKTFDFSMRELEVKQIHLTGWGYDKTPIMEELSHNAGIPMFKSISPEENHNEAFFSIEEIDFGKVKNEEKVSKIIILYNNSENSKLKFKFEDAKFIW